MWELDHKNKDRKKRQKYCNCPSKCLDVLDQDGGSGEQWWEMVRLGVNILEWLSAELANDLDVRDEEKRNQRWLTGPN